MLASKLTSLLLFSRITPPAQGGVEVSVRLLLTKTPVCCFNCPLPVSPLNDFRALADNWLGIKPFPSLLLLHGKGFFCFFFITLFVQLEPNLFRPNQKYLIYTKLNQQLINVNVLTSKSPKPLTLLPHPSIVY